MSKLSEQQILARARASSLDNVKNLNFWGSDLSDISILRQMPNVEVLSLSVNNITSLKDFAYCPRLRELYLRKNCISNINEIGCLKNLPKLKVLWLSDNPCANTDCYRVTVLKNLPKLTKLDTVVVEEAEVTEANKQGRDIPIPDDIPLHGDFTTTADMNAINADGEVENKRQTQTGTADPDSSHVNLVDETNKLRAELGIKPLLLGGAPTSTAAITTTTISTTTDIPPKEVSTISSSFQNNNILSAVLILVKELDRESLVTLRREIDQQLQDFEDTGSRSQSRNGPLEQKDALDD